VSNVWGAIAGAAGGLASAIQTQRQYEMLKLMQAAQLTAMGATLPGQNGGGDPNDPNAPAQSMASAPMNPGAALMSGAPAPTPTDPTLPGLPPGVGTSRVAIGLMNGAGNTTPGGTVGSMVPPNTGNLTQAGIAPQLGNTTQSGTTAIPTSQAAIIAMQRAAQTGPSPSSSRAMPAMAALQAANAAGAPSGPVGGDPIGGVNSGLAGAVGDYTKGMTPSGVNDLGGGVTMPRGIPPQQAAMLQTLFNAKAQQAAQTQQQQFEQGLDTQHETFESGQQSNVLAQQSALASQRDQLERDLGKATNAIQYAQIAAEIKKSDAMMSMLGQGKADAETQKITADLKPYEDQLPTIAKFQAITPQLAASNPAATQQAVLEAFQTGMGGQTFPSRLAKLAKSGPGESVTQVAQRFVQGLANGTIPAAQFQSLQQEVQTNKDALRQQHANVLAQDLAQYPMAAANPAMKNRTNALFGPAGQSSATPEPTASSFPATDQGYNTYLQAHAAWQTTQATKTK
jgi:hypothetical protein